MRKTYPLTVQLGPVTHDIGVITTDDPTGSEATVLAAMMVQEWCDEAIAANKQ